MAAKRVGQKAVDWAAFSERVPASQRVKFSALKATSDALKARLQALPEQPAAIKWDVYREKVPIAGLVDKFQKEFGALKVPYPVDSETANIDAKQKEMKANAVTLVEESNKRIAEYQKQKDRLQNLIPFDEMTPEEFKEAFPTVILNDGSYPYWPGYKIVKD